MTTILDSGDYARIRAVLGTDATALPDATILLFLDSADRAVKRLVSGWASLAGDDLAALEAAAVYLTARLIVLSQATGGGKVSGYGFSIERTTPSADVLLALAAAELDALGVALPTAGGFAVQLTRNDGYTAVEEAL